MNIKQQLQADMKEAMKAKDKLSLATIRMIIDRIQKNEKETLRDALPDEVVRIIQTFKKQTEEELAAFKQIGKLEKVAELQQSAKLIDKYLPQQMTRSDVKEIVEVLLRGIHNKGEAMKVVMPSLKGKADNKMIGEVVDEVLK